jgi:DNA-binding PadR family transcriptional regulator
MKTEYEYSLWRPNLKLESDGKSTPTKQYASSTLMHLESKVEKEMCKRALKSYLDVLILSVLENSEGMGGYDFLRLIHEEFGIFMSAGTIYSDLYALERKGLIDFCSTRKRGAFKIADKGRQFMKAAHQTKNSIQNCIERIMKKRIS